VLSHLSETIHGVSSIRAYGHQQRFIVKQNDILTENTKHIYLLQASQCWVEMRLQMLGSFISLAVALLVVYNRNELSLGAAGLSLCYSVNIVDALEEFLNKISELENGSVAVERIEEFCNLSQEDQNGEEETDWPSEGRISFIDFSARYRDGLEPVLNGNNLDIGAGEMIGICGRTGNC
jgi:ABC-type multidrug transport system fused ATPase/permease subunit